MGTDHMRQLQKIAKEHPEQPPPPEYIEQIKEDIRSKINLSIKNMQEKAAVAAPADEELRQELQIKLQKQQELLDESIRRECSASDRIKERKEELKKAEAEAGQCRRERRAITTKIERLTKQIQALESK